MDVPDPSVLEQGGRDEQAMVGRLLDERDDRREPLGLRREHRQAGIVEPDRDLGGEVLEQVAGQAELGEDDQPGAVGPGAGEQLVVAGEVLVEQAEPRRDLGEGDPERLHGPSLVGRAGHAHRPGGPGDSGAAGPGPGQLAGRAGPPAGRAGVVTGSGAAAPAAPPRPTAWTCSADPSTSSAKWQATSWPARQGRAAAGSSVTQRSGLPSRSRSQQRVWKRQPDGGCGRATARRPVRMIRRRRASTTGSGIGIADRRATVYGWSGSRFRSRDGADLDDPAEVHHRDPVADVADDREVVGDEQVGQAELGPGVARAG